MLTSTILHTINKWTIFIFHIPKVRRPKAVVGTANVCLSNSWCNRTDMTYKQHRNWKLKLGQNKNNASRKRDAFKQRETIYQKKKTKRD